MLPNRIVSLIVLMALVVTAGSAQITRYVRVSLKNTDYDRAISFMEADHVYHEDGHTIIEVPAAILGMLDNSAIGYRVLVDDLTSYYQNQNKKFRYRSDAEICGTKDHRTPLNFNLGSMGGYLTLEELKAELDDMNARFPKLITKASAISTFRTYEGRPVLWTGITGTATGDKKNVLYTALHHAREPLSMQQLVYFMWYLLENYATNPTIKKILDHTQLYFIPCVNPDGYAYNGEVSPDGGGMWRKNRRPLGSSNYGIDLNRNYGYQWGYSNSGSSDDPASELYRGESAFSEPETQAVKWFCENHEIFSALNYHAFGDYLIYPWGYKSGTTNDDLLFKSLAKSLSFEKRIVYGTSRETVLYTTNGDSDDWMYGETESKNRIYSMTPEVGPAEYGFWPPMDKIEMLCARELNQNIRMAMAPHGFVMMVPSSDPIVYTSHLVHRFYLYPVTVEDGIVQSKIIPITDNIKDFQESFYFFGLKNNEEYEAGIELKSGMMDGELVQFVLKLDNGILTMSDTVSYIYSTNKESIDVLSQSTDIENWVRSSQLSNSWGNTTTEYYTEPSSITDSPQGVYATGTENSIISSESYRIPGEEEVFLTFKAKWDITCGNDFAQLSISTDGVQFIPLCGNLTTEGFDYQGNVSPVYTGTQKEWLTEKISLNNYRGEDVYFKWNMVSESADAKEGIFVDDMKITFSQTITSSDKELVDWQNHKLYPNPVGGQSVYLKLAGQIANDPVVRYEIRNQLGQLMGSDVIADGVTQIQVGEFPSGLYLLGLITSSGRRTEMQKLIVMP